MVARLYQRASQEIYGTALKLDREHILGQYEVNPITKPHCSGELFRFEEIIDYYKEDEEMVKRYATVAELPEWAREAIQYLLNKGYIADTDNLNLTEDMARILVVNYRAGLY